MPGGIVEIAVPDQRYDRVMDVISPANTNNHTNKYTPSTLGETVEESGLTILSNEKRKWWAAVSIVGKSAFYRMQSELFSVNDETGIWRPNPDSQLAQEIACLVDRGVQGFERVAKKFDGTPIGNLLNTVFPFEIYIQATKSTQEA